MESRQKADPEFFYDFQLDGEGHLKTMFWCDSQSRMDYQSFGDVVVFDSTYRMNRYKMPFVPFVGMNHHRSTTIFGCGIVSDERIESYVWMLSAFLKAMCQKKPESIITDGDYSMMKAIRQVLPGVNHRICTWHVEENLPKHLRKKAVEAFRPLMYYGTSPATFEDRWNAFLAKHQTARNSHWLSMMYKNKKLWAASFQFEKKFLGMKSNQRSESLNSSLHRHLDRKMSLLDLAEHYENCVSRLRETEAELDCRASQSMPVPLTDHKRIEVACCQVFTVSNFNILQGQIAKIDDFEIFETLVGEESERFIVARKDRKKSLYLVDYWYMNSDIKVKCTCRKMEREGLPCCHILVVLDHLEFSALPKCCILQRLSKNAKGGLPSK
jgi:zinc finger SWIM domain-containing protein 3